MDEEVRPTSIAERIAALKLNEVGQRPSSKTPTNGNGITKRPPPPLPTRSSESTHSLVTASAGLNVNAVGNQPAAAPVRVTKPPPSLPPRRPSEAPSLSSKRHLDPLSLQTSQLSRRASKESIASTVSNFSLASNKTGVSSATTAASPGAYTIRAPAYDPSTLPPLPPKKTPEEIANTKRGSISKTTSTTSIPQRPNLPQRQSTRNTAVETVRRTEPAPPRKSALLQGFGQSEKSEPRPSARPEQQHPNGNSTIGRGDDEAAPRLPTRRASAPIPEDEVPDQGAPPPIPTASRPDLAQLRLSKPKPSAVGSQPQSNCLQCRDFSAQFDHAARFPRESIPSQEPSWLAHNLTSPFNNATDKAFVIFAWLHHNIDYNTVAFFSGNVKGSTPKSTIATGLAVCEGYAGLFVALAALAGLEARVVGGHGKGFGYTPLGPGEPVPPFNAGHAWAVVKLDDGQWKLLDPCWGAGNINGQQYNRHWTPLMFTAPNDVFGETHFPEDRKSFYRRDGRYPSWEEYLVGADGLGASVMVFSGFTWEEGVNFASIMPRQKRLSIAAERQKGTTRFSFSKVCEHWDGEKHGKGKPYCYALYREGKPPAPFSYNGYTWWLDVPAQELGEVGQDVKICAVDNFDGGSGRGVTREEMLAKLGRVGMGYGFMCLWDIVP